jgi:predicted flap endonuclease-1-like 5' DNA nuclease
MVEFSAAAADSRRDPLIDVDGIGPVYEKRLFEAGIYTFEQLAALTPEQVIEIIKPQGWQKIEAEAWIAESRMFAEQVRAGTYQRKED